jgi:hypothetical protein
MRTFKMVSTALLQLLLAVALLTGNARGALLDLGPTVAPVIGSTPPNLRHGFPLWYRDTNRVPLQLCTDEVMCLFLRPNTAQPTRFPDNMPDEVFFYSAEAQMTTTGGDALLFSGVEGNIAIDDAGAVTLVSFARVRIRIDTTVPGNYLVTTPYKQYAFNNVPAGRRAINFTEDIGLGPNGVFDGALSGSIGPFVYSQGAPFLTATGSYIGDNTPRVLQGSTFTDPRTGQPANVFRIEGPSGFTTASTNLFSVTGNIYPGVIPTPLKVDRATYARNAAATELQVSVYATSKALSNQVNGALAFPLRYALTGAPSVLQVTGTGLPSQNLSTNAPGDGKFFADSGIIASTDTPPATVNVTNTSDTPATTVSMPLHDEVVIEKAVYSRQNSTLLVKAASFDRKADPALKVFMPGMVEPLGELSEGQLSVSFPVTDSSGGQTKVYAIPPETISVVSALGGSASAPVSALTPPFSAAVPSGTIAINGGAAFTNSASVTLSLSASSLNGPVTQMQFSNDGVTFSPLEAIASSKVLTLTPADGSKTVYVRYFDQLGQLSLPVSASIVLDATAPALGAVTLNGGAAQTLSRQVNLSLAATDAYPLTMQFSLDGVNFSAPEPFATLKTLDLPSGDGVKTVTVQVSDAAGNVSTAVRSVTLNTGTFNGDAVINGGAAVATGSLASVAISASSSAGSVTQMQFSWDGVTYTGLENYATTRNVNLLSTPGNGIKTLYTRFRNSLGQLSPPVVRSITLQDNVLPTGTIAFTTPGPTNQGSAVLALTASDATGVSLMQFSKDGVNYFAFEPFATSRTVTIPIVGVNTLTVRFKDGVGNVSLPISASITRIP